MASSPSTRRVRVRVFFPESKRWYDLRTRQAYYIPIKHAAHPELWVVARPRVAMDARGVRFVSIDEHKTKGVRQIVRMQDVDQSRHILTYKNNAPPSVNTRRTHLWFPESRRMFRVRHNTRYRVPVGKTRTIDAIYKHGLGQPQGTFISVHRHRVHKLHYGVPPHKIDQNRSILEY
jgi:hypothetical protein